MDRTSKFTHALRNTRLPSVEADLDQVPFRYISADECQALGKAGLALEIQLGFVDMGHEPVLDLDGTYRDWTTNAVLGRLVEYACPTCQEDLITVVLTDQTGTLFEGLFCDSCEELYDSAYAIVPFVIR